MKEEKREIVRKEDLEEGRKKYVKEERKKEREIQKKGKRTKKLGKARVTKDEKRKRERSQGIEKVKEGKNSNTGKYKLYLILKQKKIKYTVV